MNKTHREDWTLGAGITHDTASYTSCNTGTHDVVKTLLVWRSGSIWTHEFIR